MTDRKPEDVRALIARARELSPHAYDCHHVMVSLADACEQLLDLVSRLQWGSCDRDREGCDPSMVCPICANLRNAGHAPECPIAALGLPAGDE